MAIRRETEPSLLETIATLPDVKPHIVFTEGPIDWGQVIQGCIVLSNGKDAVSIFEESEPRVFEGHILFAPSHRGTEAEATARAMVAWMIPEHADSIWGAIPNDNRAARLFMRRIGFTPIAGEEVELFYTKRAE
ncbi:MAG TPA: hypothetical protein VFS91_04235 [Nitrobacter sp.]|nr:hypothetical protein [Nitrobacter sp.]